jgi:hypothetical protein
MSTAAPLLTAVIRTDQPYWENAFFGQILSPISCDILFTVDLLIVSDTYPKHMKPLGGEVFDTYAQIGGAIGLSDTQVIASTVTSSVTEDGKGREPLPKVLTRGYRVALWAPRLGGGYLSVLFVCWELGG